MTDRELMQQALYALEYASDMTKPENMSGCGCPICVTITALRERLKQPDQEPVAWINWSAFTGQKRLGWECESELASQPLYTAPPQRKPLTYKQILNISKECRAVEGPSILWVTFARAIEDVHGIKENNT